MELLASLKRVSQSEKVDCKRLKSIFNIKEILTTNAETQEIKLLSKLKYFDDIENVPPKYNEDTEKIDPIFIELQKKASEEMKKIQEYCKFFEESYLEEEEILSRISERKEFLIVESEKFEKNQREIEKKIEEINREIYATEGKTEKDKAFLWTLERSLESEVIRNNELKDGLIKIEGEIEVMKKNEYYLVSQIGNAENDARQKIGELNYNKDCISDLVVECNELHKLSLDDEAAIMKIKEGISRYSNNN